MTEQETLFTDGFVESMRALSPGALQHVLEEPRMFRRSALTTPGCPGATFTILHFLGWLYLGAR